MTENSQKKTYSPFDTPDDKSLKNSRRLIVSLIALCLVIVALCVIVFSQLFKEQQVGKTVIDMPAEQESEQRASQAEANDDVLASAAEAVLYLEIYDENDECIGTASGFLVNSDLTLVTNYHVVQDAYRITAWTQDDWSVDVSTLLAYDEVADLAVLRCNTSLFVDPLLLADSDEVKKGQSVYAMGYPLGLANTISDGIISARYVDDYGVDTLQTTASISEGNSGGPLLDENGQVIGIMCASYVYGQNMNVAIASNTLRQLLNQKTTAVNLFDWADRPIMPDQKEEFESETEPEAEPEPENKNEQPPEAPTAIETKPQQTGPIAPTGISLNVPQFHNFVSVGETLQLVATIEPYTAEANITWSSSAPKSVSVDGNGVVTVLNVNSAAAVITAETDNGVAVKCKIIAQQNYQPCQSSSNGLVYTKFPEVLSIENVRINQNDFGLWSEYYLDYTGTTHYSYQTNTKEVSEAYVSAYADYLTSNGYTLVGHNAEIQWYAFNDPSGKYEVTVQPDYMYDDLFYIYTIGININDANWRSS